MMQHDRSLALLKQTRLVAILRGVRNETAVDVAAALYEGGVRALEFTFDHDDPDCVARNCERIHAVRSRFPDDLLVGCGTALTVEEVEKSVAAGGQLVISPNTDAAVIRRTRELGAVSMPGALTPTEIVAAYQAGADLIKLFPAGELGVGYIRAVRGPLSHIPMTAVGGVRPETVAAFLDAGVLGFGVGGELVRKDLLRAGDMAGLTARAREFVDAIEAWEARREA